MKQMRNRLTMVILFGGLIMAAGAMAIVYKLIPVWALAPLSAVNAIAIAAVMRGRAASDAQEYAGTKPIGRLSLIWPLGLLFGACLAIFDAARDGWKAGDAIGAVVCFVVLFAYLLAYRKQRNGRSSL